MITCSSSQATHGGAYSRPAAERRRRHRRRRSSPAMDTSMSGTPQQMRLKKSLAWVCFNSIDDKQARCRSCSGVVSWTDAKCTTRTMWWHLYSKHRTQHDKLKILADKLKMTYDGARQKVNFDHHLDNRLHHMPSTSDSGEKENEMTEIAQFLENQIELLFAAEMGKNADIPSLLTPKPPRRRPGAHLAKAEPPMSPMQSNLDIMSEGSRASSPNTVDPSLSSPSPSPSDATHEGFSQHSFTSLQTPMSGNPAIDFSTPLSPGASNGDQHYIKRPLNAYMMWTREERKKILAEDPKMKMHDISREMGERWKAMSDQEKKPYFDKAKAQKAEHKKILSQHPSWSYQPNKMKNKNKNKTSPAANGTATPSTPMTPSTTSNGRPASSATPATPNGIRTNGNTFQRPAPPPQAQPQQAPVAAALLSTPQQQVRQVGGPVTAGGPVRVVQAQGTAYHPYAQNGPRYAKGPNGETYIIQQNGHPPAARPNYVAQAHSQANGGYQPPPQVAKPPPNMNQVLDMYYTSLCQPAFPEQGEPPGRGMAPSNFYLEQYHSLQHQQYLSQYHNYQQQNQFTSNGKIYQSI